MAASFAGEMNFSRRASSAEAFTPLECTLMASLEAFVQTVQAWADEVSRVADAVSVTLVPEHKRPSPRRSLEIELTYAKTGVYRRWYEIHWPRDALSDERLKKDIQDDIRADLGI